MTGIIISLIALVMCLLATVTEYKIGSSGGTIGFGTLSIVNAIVLTANIISYATRNDVKTIDNVKNYYVDSTVVVNGTDTTKTYKIMFVSEN